MSRIELIGLRLPEVRPGDDLASLIAEAACDQAGCLHNGDILVVTSKIISKARGYIVNMADVKPSRNARLLARILGKDPGEAEVILRLSKRVLAVVPIKDAMFELDIPGRSSIDKDEARRVIKGEGGILIVEMYDRRVCSDAGLDLSNVQPGHATYPPLNPDEEACGLRKRICELCGVEVGVVISDTEFFPFKVGSIDIAIGACGVRVSARKFAAKDRFGRPKFGGLDLIADGLAAATSLIMGQTDEGWSGA